jgi:ribosomal protein L44E
MKRRVYPLVEAGEWIKPRRSDYRLRCCDCGLVHVMQFRIRGKKLEFRAIRRYARAHHRLAP